MAQVFGIPAPNVISPLAGIADLYGTVKDIELAKERLADEKAARREKMELEKAKFGFMQDQAYAQTPQGQVDTLTKLFGGDSARAWQIVGSNIYQNTMLPEAKMQQNINGVRQMMDALYPSRGAEASPSVYSGAGGSLQLPRVQSLPMAESPLPR